MKKYLLALALLVVAGKAWALRPDLNVSGGSISALSSSPTIAGMGPNMVLFTNSSGQIIGVATFSYVNGQLTVGSTTANGIVGIVQSAGVVNELRLMNVNVSGADNPIIHLVNLNTGISATDGFKLRLTNGTDVALTLFENANMLFGVGNTERMRLNATGLGIGTVSLATKLHVSSGALRLDGTSPNIGISTSAAAPAVIANTAFFYATGATTAEMWTQGGNGDETQLTSHVDGEYAIIARSSLESIVIPMVRLARQVEKLTGKKFVWNSKDEYRAWKRAVQKKSMMPHFGLEL